jgi:hypothetical protein
MALPSGSWAGTVFSTRRTGSPSLQACMCGGASRLHHTSSAKPRALSCWLAAIWIRRSRRFCSLVGRVGTDDPVCGAWPLDAHADDGLQHRRACEGGVAQALLVTHFSSPFERPDTRQLAKGPGALVQDGAYLRPFLRVQHVAYRLWRTGSDLRDTRGCLSLSARKPYLAAAHSEGSRTAQPRCERGALVVCDMAHIERWCHSVEPSASTELN